MFSIFSQLYRRNTLLAIAGWVHIGLLVLFLICMPFDNRLITGINPWIKPAKFAVSIAIFFWTMGWIMYYLQQTLRKVKIYSWIFAVALSVEMLIIGFQAARGTTSHFNVFSSAFDGALFSLMGIFITINLVITLLVLFDFFLQKTDLPHHMLWAIRLGLFSLILASLEGFVMVGMLSHTVGAQDGGPGLPGLNWSTVAGDLRVAHFLGMHGLQLFPMFAYFIGQWQQRLSAKLKTGMVVSFAIVYLVLMNFTLWQALNKTPVLQLNTANMSQEISKEAEGKIDFE
jgi:hypothetical protein